MDSIYKMLLNYQGYGNPKGKYWIIGMEEHWKIKDPSDESLGCDQKSVNYYAKKIVPFKLAKDDFYGRVNSRGKTYERGIQNLLKKLEGEEKFRYSLENHTFITNSRFAPFATQKQIRTTFKITKEKYFEDDSSYKNKIFNLWTEGLPKKTFCLSKTYTSEFTSLFQKGIPNFKFVDLTKNEIFIRKFQRAGLSIYQIFHPSARGFDDEYLNEIKKRIE